MRHLERRSRWFIAGGISLSLIGCGTTIPSYQASVGVSINHAAFKGTGIKPGIVLGWHGHLYRLVNTVGPAAVGHRLGDALYHGTLGRGFTLYTFVGHPISYGIIFKSNLGKSFVGISTKIAGGHS